MTYRTQRSSLLHCFGHGDEFSSNGTRKTNGYVAECFASSGNDTRGFSGEDFFGSAGDGYAGGDACHSNSMSTNTRRKPRINRRLPRNITRPHFLNHSPRQNVIDIILIQCRFRDESLVGQSLKIHGQLIFIDGRGHGEGEAYAIDDDDIFGGVGGLTCGRKVELLLLLRGRRWVLVTPRNGGVKGVGIGGCGGFGSDLARRRRNGVEYTRCNHGGSLLADFG
mmetsp:Transcript_21479/g.45405  ORF Transcript_21479/g.45405 Transcript_21479/m.45405 type:complete len:223 (-) Transcript_21479:32-700(-)